MRFDLATSDCKEKIGDVLLDRAPEVGGTVHFAEATWRVEKIAWMRDAGNNSLSSGLLCVERIDDDTLTAAVDSALEKDEPLGLTEEDRGKK
jgi:hypothetical protein